MNKKDKQQPLVPRLRFPEFRKSPAWGIMRLGDALKFQPGYPFPSSGFNEAGAGLRLIRNRDLRSDDAVIYYSSSYDESFVVKDGDLLIGMDGDFTPCVWEKGEALLNQRVGRITAKAKNDLQFLRYFLTAHLKDIEDATPRTTVKHLSHSDVERLHEALPEPSEQRKIANCLGSLDDLIAAEGRKLAALRDHKKGLMQQLFPREGETRPRLRFPEFRDAGEWQVQPLGKAATFINGRAYKKDELLSEGTYPVLRVGNIFSSSEWYYSELELEEDKYCDAGDLLYAWSASFGPKIWEGGKTIYHYHIWKVVPEDEVEKRFLFTVLDRETQRMKADNARGLGMLHITKGSIETWECAIPELAEQHRIADCLTSLDTMIAAQAEKLDALRTHKRGLMQHLFPSPEGAGA